jgi:tetratricopeptide (TPR) repeat protein
MALFQSGEHDRAFETFSSSYAQDSTMSPPELSLAAMHVKAGEFDEAGAWYHKALENYPDDAQVQFEYGSALLVEGRYDEAKERIDKAVESSTFLEAHATDVALMRGFLARARGEFSEAERHFAEVRRKSPGNATALQQLVAVLVEQPSQAKRNSALQLAQYQAKKQPASPSARATLAWVYHRLDRKDEALRALGKGTLPRDTESLYYTARVLFEHGDPKDARPAILALQTALGKRNLFVLRDEAREWLETALLAIN